jgi:hypothetical protein
MILCWLVVPGLFPLLRGALGEQNQTGGKTPIPAIEPDPELQNALLRFVHPTGKDPGQERLLQLRKLSRAGHQKLIPQLVYYSAYGSGRSGQHDLEDAMVAGYLLDRFAIDHYTLARALLPYFKSDNPKLRKVLDNIGLDSAGLRALARGEAPLDQAATAHFVRELYHEHPGDALLLMAHSALLPDDPVKVKSLLWAEHVLGDAIWEHNNGFLDTTKVEPETAAELGKLCKYDEWWVRLYVAEILRQHPAFRTPELIARLAVDKNPLVRDAMDFTKAKPKAPAKPPAGKAPPPPA